MSEGEYDVVRLGVCAMSTKVHAKPMQEVLRRIAEHSDVEIVEYGDDTILHKPIDEWPIVDVFLSFHSDGFPLSKAISYVKLRKCFSINDLSSHEVLFDRVATYKVLEQHHVPIPRYVVSNRDPERGPLTPAEEFEDHIVVDGVAMSKPFIEKPVDAEDHDVWVHYAAYQGGGVRKLFRKVGNKSSAFYPELCEIRTDKSYLYEEFFETDENADLKIYCVLPNYILAQQRKAPTVDGIVERDERGREIRRFVPLSDEERRICFKLGTAFRNRVYGFDILRVDGKPFVCDVNGWSFVKGVPQYYDHCARILTRLVRQAKSLNQYKMTSERLVTKGDRLRGVIGVFRHGDRAPKQKIKVAFRDPNVLCLFGDLSYELVCKRENDPDWFDRLREKLEHILEAGVGGAGSPDASALEMILHVIGSGYTELKMQVKPHNVRKNESGIGVAESATVVLKWGGFLTHAGIHQLRSVGQRFRDQFLSLGVTHSDMHRAVRVVGNSERRVLRSAREFTKALLNSNHFSTDVLKIDDKLLQDRTRETEEKLRDIKNRLSDILLTDRHFGTSEADYANTTVQALLSVGLRDLGNPLQSMQRLHKGLRQIRDDVLEAAKRTTDQDEGPGLCERENLHVAAQRWEKSVNDLFNEDTMKWDTTKITQVFDMLKYDAVHSRGMISSAFGEVYRSVQRVADFVIPQEFGLDPTEKVEVGHMIVGPLLQSILNSIEMAVKKDELMCQFYCTGESHIHALLNLLMHGINRGLLVNRRSFVEINYVSHFLFKIFQRPDGSVRIQISFSTGASDDVFENVGVSHALPIEYPIVFHESLNLEELRKVYTRALDHRKAMTAGILKGVVALFRHADRTPKQKIKGVVTGRHLLEFFGECENELKRASTKHPKYFAQLADAMKTCLREDILTDSERTFLTSAVKQLGAGVQGVKIQVRKCGAGLSINLKWGGVLTHAGVAQARSLGTQFQNCFLTDDRSARLAFMQNTRAAANDELRVQQTMYSFLEGFYGKKYRKLCQHVVANRTKVSVQSLSRTPPKAEKLITAEKERVCKVLLSVDGSKHMRHYESDADSIALHDDGLPLIKKPLKSMEELLSKLRAVFNKLENRQDVRDEDVCGPETFDLMKARWRKVLNDWYDSTSEQFRGAVLREVFDNVKYDAIHNRTLMPAGFQSVVRLASKFSSFITPQEFGLRQKDKLRIAAIAAEPLLAMIVSELEQAAFAPSRSLRFFFGSELLMHGLLNVLTLGGTNGVLVHRRDIGQLDFLTHFVFRVYEHQNSTFHIDVLFSTGAANVDFESLGSEHLVPTNSPLLLLDNSDLAQLRRILFVARDHLAD